VVPRLAPAIHSGTPLWRDGQGAECRRGPERVAVRADTGLKIWSTSPHRKPEFTPIVLCETVAIIAVTSDSLNGEEQTARAAGCDDYVPKPFSPRQLLAKIRQFLQ